MFSFFSFRILGKPILISYQFEAKGSSLGSQDGRKRKRKGCLVFFLHFGLFPPFLFIPFFIIHLFAGRDGYQPRNSVPIAVPTASHPSAYAWISTDTICTVADQQSIQVCSCNTVRAIQCIGLSEHTHMLVFRPCGLQPPTMATRTPFPPTGFPSSAPIGSDFTPTQFRPMLPSVVLTPPHRPPPYRPQKPHKPTAKFKPGMRVHRCLCAPTCICVFVQGGLLPLGNSFLRRLSAWTPDFELL